jgi:hypothetical protein
MRLCVGTGSDGQVEGGRFLGRLATWQLGVADALCMVDWYTETADAVDTLRLEGRCCDGC